MFNNTKNTIAASEMITNLEKSGKIGSKSAVEKIKKALQEEGISVVPLGEML